jgi:hypothetical protein
MPLVSPFIPAGPYAVVWNNLNIGLTDGPIRMQQSIYALPVRATQYGQTIIDYVLQGGGAFGILVLKEWTQNARRFIWPVAANTSPDDMGTLDRPGNLMSVYARPLVLAAMSGTPAAAYGPVTRTYPYVIPLPGHNIDITFGPMERNIVVALAVLPNTTAVVGRVQFFYDT